MDIDAFLNAVRKAPGYAGQIVHMSEMPAREALYGPDGALSPAARRALERRGIHRLYSHQVEALEHARAGRDPLIATGTASGKTLCYQIPIVELLEARPEARALLLFPTKALCQDQYKSFARTLEAAGLSGRLAGVYDGDTPASTRRKLRDHASVLFTNPDMLHASLLPQHGRWAPFLANLEMVVLDELHVYSGIFGANAANLFRRLWRVCRHYGSAPRVAACSATIGNPLELGRAVVGREMALVDRDGSPRGRRVFVFWNPPRIRGGQWRSRRSANVEAHELAAELIRRGAATIVFSKAKMTAEMIHRYICDNLRKTAPHLVAKVTPYRGGYLPEERREIERRLFAGELLGVSSTPALELGIDVGALEASVLVGYPGTLSSFFQQAGRAGRQDRDALVLLIGLDTAVNQFIMSDPEYIFGRAIERGVVEPDNPYVVSAHLRCAAHELPLADAETTAFGSHAETALGILEENGKVRRLGEAWYHAASEVPQHEISLRGMDDANVLIEDADSGAMLGEITKLDAPPILHPEAIYMHRGDTYRVLELDLERRRARVQRVEVDYYTQALGGTDVHHIDYRLREKPFGTGQACWGEVTAYFTTWAYEKIHFYTLDAVSRHGLRLPKFQLETMAVWLVAPEALMERARAEGLDAHQGLRGLGYATRMLLPLFITCDTLDFSHSVGCVNAPWNAVFIYERYPHGLGFTEKAYDLLHELMPRVLEHVRRCPCEEGCPSCVGKPLRQATIWNVERGEASIPSKRAALYILEGLLGDRTNLCNADTLALSDSAGAAAERLERALRRRLERMREPELFHPIEPVFETAYPDIEKPEALAVPDVARRIVHRTDFERKLRKRLAKGIPTHRLEPLVGRPAPPDGMKGQGSGLPPTRFPGRPPESERYLRRESPEKPAIAIEPATLPPAAPEPSAAKPKAEPIRAGDSLASRARRLRKTGI